MSLFSGVYIIENKTNKKVYVGSTRNFCRRWRVHMRDLNNNKHHNIYLQRAWNLSGGKQNFDFKILVQAPKGYLARLEQHFMDVYQSYNSQTGYNIAKTAVISSHRYKHSEETLQKLRKPKSPETCLKLSQSRKGIPSWNRGKTKETDPRLRMIGEKISKARPPRVNLPKLRELIAQGAPATYCAKILGFNSEYLYRYCRKYAPELVDILKQLGRMYQGKNKSYEPPTISA